MLKKKCKSIVLVILCLFVFSIQIISAQSLPLQDTIIMVDAGHGGRDSGTYYGDILEKDINLEIAKELEKELTKYGTIVYMTRKRDVDLSSIYDSAKKRGDLYRRLLLIKEKKCDLYISIHINWYDDNTLRGAEVLYNSINKENKVLAQSIMNRFKKELDSNRNIKTTDLYMYRNTTTPGVLVECGYLSNPTERKLLQKEEYQKRLAKTITKGIIDFMKKGNKVKYVI
ncbi:MAG TPA: N-acetylmuramoyl-L-alanine amidase [Candidatus Faecimonas intestinavium]|nr:N-acetylmuramoyl-L-alanine amidase [Candidatus Faecimonas intestinavium]